MMIIDTNHFEVDLVYDRNNIGFGASMGSNSSIGKRPDNLYIEFDFLFWRIGFEVNRIHRWVPRWVKRVR